jgi:Icc-related predicted phosphoesterase
MVTHVHPSDSLIEKVSPILKGSDAVKKAIKTFKPDYALCSHVHEAEGISEKIDKTQVINVGKKGRILEFIV